MRFQFSALTPFSSFSGQRSAAGVRDPNSEARSIAIEDPQYQSEIAVALQRVLACEMMRKSPKLQSFLTYIVDETMAGRGDRLKAYSIAIAALGKHSAFDPSIDPIVRVEASRLRRCLNAYYASDGQNDPLRITMPKGSYRPIFKRGISGPNVIELKSALDSVPRTEPAGVEIKSNLSHAIPLARVSKTVDQMRLYQVSRIMLIANICMIMFTLIFGIRVILDIQDINARMDKFQSLWSRHVGEQSQ